MGWIEFAAAFAVFFLSHSVPVRPAVRSWLRGRLGPRGFTLAYSILSLVVLLWLIDAARRAPYVALWDWAPWQNWIVLTAMLLVCLILAFSIGRPNPLSFGGSRDTLFDPAHPGIVRVSRHPILLALAIWSLAHLVPNGNLAHTVLFGTFAAFALFGQRLVDRRKRRELGANWDHLIVQVQRAPYIAGYLPSAQGLARLAMAVLLYIGLLWLHPSVFGVSPLP